MSIDLGWLSEYGDITLNEKQVRRKYSGPRDDAEYHELPLEEECFFSGDMFTDSLALDKKAGSGGSGVVYVGLLDRQRVAVKVPYKSGGLEEESRILRELNDRMDSPHLLNILDYGEVELPDGIRSEAMVTEELTPNVQDFYKSDIPITVDFETGISAALQIFSTLEELHEKGYVMVDIKPENIMMRNRRRKTPGSMGTYSIHLKFKEMESVMIDAGSAVSLRDFKKSMQECTRYEKAVLAGKKPDGEAPEWPVIRTTPNYTAPEVVTQRKLGSKMDVYAAALVLYEMLTGKGPYEGKSGFKEIRKEMKKGKPPVSLDETDNIPLFEGEKVIGENSWENIKSYLKNFFSNVLNPDPLYRFSSREAAEFIRNRFLIKDRKTGKPMDEYWAVSASGTRRYEMRERYISEKGELDRNYRKTLNEIREDIRKKEKLIGKISSENESKICEVARKLNIEPDRDTTKRVGKRNLTEHEMRLRKLKKALRTVEMNYKSERSRLRKGNCGYDDGFRQR